jgi:hypothetical protein
MANYLDTFLDPIMDSADISDDGPALDQEVNMTPDEHSRLLRLAAKTGASVSELLKVWMVVPENATPDGVEQEIIQLQRRRARVGAAQYDPEYRVRKAAHARAVKATNAARSVRLQVRLTQEEANMLEAISDEYATTFHAVLRWILEPPPKLDHGLTGEQRRQVRWQLLYKAIVYIPDREWPEWAEVLDVPSYRGLRHIEDWHGRGLDQLFRMPADPYDRGGFGPRD